MIKKNLKEWEECLPHVEFAYNRAVHSTTELCPFEVVYGFKPITPLDLLPLTIHERVNMEASKRADFVKKIHVKTKELIEKKGKSNAARMNKKRKEMLFKPGDLVWVHFRKDRFPKLRKSKLKPRGAGPYKVLAKINDNAYSIDLPEDEFGVGNSFNVADLTPYDGEDLGASGSTPFEGGEMMRTSLPHYYLRHYQVKMNLLYEEETSIARGGEEQLDKELDMKISHGRAREEREECARGEEEVQAGPPGDRPPCRPPPGPAEKHDELLMKNHNARPTGAMPIPEAHANAHFTNKFGNRKRNFRKFKGKWKNNGQRTNGQFKGKGHFKKNDQNDNSQVCQRCGCANHRTNKCRIPKHLVDLYMKYGGKGKQVHGNKAGAHFNVIEDNPQASPSQSAIEEFKPKDNIILDEDMLVDCTQDVFGDLN
ncbi:hypothetical protein QYE76_063694 [Lolium multiflorum]|uniref:Tf2-1-like SH3-like domain-containing protein n=1 Tax=Lolium multiflorum TaxID=4521 RepID=A0AAD8W9C6_LOLMU|nr:hypothetical protein QYE76_063694 [Lolium multiflorum]